MIAIDPGFSLSALAQIIGLNLVLSGDNALVIALVMQRLQPRQRRIGVAVGLTGAVLMRMALSVGVWRLLELPGLRLTGGLTLLWMGWQLANPPAPQPDGQDGPGDLAGAIRQVIWADAVMSADNVLAIAGAAHGNLPLLLTGIATSIPFVALGSGLLGRLLDRFPVLLALGAGLLGWVGGSLAGGDPLLDAVWPVLRALLAPVAGLMLLLAGWRARRHAQVHPH